MLETCIKITLAGRLVMEIPLEAFYHLQNFFKGQRVLDFPIPGNAVEVVMLPKNAGFKTKDGMRIRIKALKTKRLPPGVNRPMVRPVLR